MWLGLYVKSPYPGRDYGGGWEILPYVILHGDTSREVYDRQVCTEVYQVSTSAILERVVVWLLFCS